MSIRTLLLTTLAATSALFASRYARALHATRGDGQRTRPTLAELAIGFVTNFFDTLGIGSFAPTTAVFRARKMVPDELIPGTLNVGHAPAAIAQAFVFVTVVDVEPRTLAAMVSAALAGAWLGAGVVVRWPRARIQVAMGLALLCAALFFAGKNLALIPGGGDAIGLSGGLLVAAVLGNFVLGALMMVGVGLFAPCMVLVSVLGMSPTVAFPIMMGSCALLMPIASLRFLRAGRFARGPALGLSLGAVPAVLLAALVVKELPLTMLRWLVVVVVVYTSVTMLRAGVVGRSRAGSP